MSKKLFISDENRDMIVDQDGILCAAAYGNNSIERAACASRIVACVNACAGISTGSLEGGGVGSLLSLGLEEQKRGDIAEKQRNDLLSACKDALENGSDGDWQSARQILVKAISDTKGGAA